MRYSNVFAASLVAPLVAAHGAGPKIFGLASRDIAMLKSRNILGGHHARNTHSHSNHRLDARQGGDVDNRCGPPGNGASCAEGWCCSGAGYCGKTTEYCAAPDGLFAYGPANDANVVPSGGSTRSIPRPVLGDQYYGGEGIYSCVTPGTVAITYDDGPYSYTNDVITQFNTAGFKATFFITGRNIGKGSIDDESTPWPGMIRNMLSGGHQIASHTWSHQDLSAITKEQRYEQMVKNEMAIANIIGKFPTYMRPPYSSCSAESGCAQDMVDLGYVVSYFDLDTDDYNNLTPEKIQNAKDNFKNAIVGTKPAEKDFLAVAHDIHELTAHNLTAVMLKTLQDAGYRGVTMGECMGDPEANWYRSATSGRVATTSSFSAPPTGTPTASSSVSVSASATVSSTAPSSTATVSSKDGSCGGTNGYTCKGWAGGSCCSQYGWCGAAENYCGTGCNPLFGTCGLASSSSSSAVASSSSPVASSSSSVFSSAARSSSASSSAASTPVSSTVRSSSVASSTPVSSTVRSSSVASSTPVSSTVRSSSVASSAPVSSTVRSSSVASSTVRSSTPVPSSTVRSSTPVPSSTRASSTVRSSTPSATPTARVSTNGSCGLLAGGTTCLGSTFGNCCSLSLGRCGSSTLYCSTVLCNPLYGNCGSNAGSSVVSSTLRTSSTRTSSAPASTATKKSTDGACGAAGSNQTCQGSTFGNCCSQYGWCGSSTTYCGTGCQKGYGTCT